MAQQLTIAPAGLWTDPNPLSAAPDGAMTEALNVVIARPGVVEPRPGLQVVGSPYSSLDTGLIFKSIYWTSGGAILFAYNQTLSEYQVYFGITEIQQAGEYVRDAYWTSTRDAAPRILVYGTNVYIVCDEGVMRFSSSGGSAYRAGLARPPQAQVDSATTGGVNYPLVADRAVAYRLCHVRESDADKFRSPPSARILARSYTGSGAKRVTLTFANTSSWVTEVYRSTALAANDSDEPTDEMTLIGTAAASAATFVDDASFTGLAGPSLYTNGTQDGALLENGITPFCRDIAIFREMMFFANAQWAPSLTFEVLGFGPDWRGSNASTADRLTSFTITGTPAGVGSNTVNTVSASDIAMVRVGQRVYLDSSNPTIADAVFPAACYVQSVDTGAGSFTVSPVLLSAPGASSIRLSDWIEVSIEDDDGTTTERVFCDDASGTNYVDAREFQASTTANVRGPQQMAHELSDELDGKATVSAFGDGVTGAWTFIVETYGYDVDSLTVKTSNANAISSRIDSTTGETVSSAPNGVVAWSKPGEPEHVPPGYQKRIATSAVERFATTSNALFAFTLRDGVYRFSGYSPDSLQVDDFDRTMRLVHANAVCECAGRVAAWTNKGLMLISDAGAVDIGKPIANLLEDAAPDVSDHETGLGVFLTWWADRSMLLLGVPNSTTTAAEYIYAWHERSNTWTRWSSSKLITCAASFEDTLYLGTAAASAGADTEILASVPDSYDVSTAVTVSAVSGRTVTISAGSGWTPAVGDILRQSSEDYAVTAITSATVFTVHTTGVTAAAATALTRATMQVEWTVRDGENPGGQKLFREATFVLGSASGLVSADSSYTSDRSQTASTTAAAQTYTTSDVPTTIRTRIPRESRRCGRLEHSLTLKGAKPAWQLHGASYVFEPTSTRFRDAS